MRLSSSIAPGKFLAAICARTAESLSGAGCGLGGVSAAKAWVANSSAVVIRMRLIAVFMVGSVVWVERHRRRRLPALTRPIPERMQRDREKLPELDAVLRQDEVSRRLAAGLGRRRFDAHRELRDVEEEFLRGIGE